MSGHTDTIDKVVTKNKVELKKPKMWNVVFHNDDFTPMELVILILVQIFRKSMAEATDIMLTVHKTGKGIAGTYTHEVAEHKKNEAMGAARANDAPLKVTIEENI